MNLLQFLQNIVNIFSSVCLFFALLVVMCECKSVYFRYDSERFAIKCTRIAALRTVYAVHTKMLSFNVEKTRAEVESEKRREV